MSNNVREQDILMIMTAAGAVITNSHIIYTSGKHGTAYVNKDALYPDTDIIADLCLRIAMEFEHDGVEVVIAPAIGGVILTQWTAHQLMTLNNKRVLAVYAEREDIFSAEVRGAWLGERFVIKRGYDKIVRGRRVLVVEDILTTGGSVKKVVEATRAIGGEVVGLAALCNRGGITAHDVGDVPRLFSLTNVTFDAWEAVDCPLCARGVPINTEVGKGREFLAKKKL